MTWKPKLNQNAIKWAPLLICALMVGVHIFLVENLNGDSWKFGGWRMFSQVSEKILTFHGEATNGKTYPIAVAENLDISRAQSLPTQAQLKKVLESISTKRVTKNAEGFTVASPKDALLNFNDGFVTAEPLYKWTVKEIFTTLHVSVWDLQFDANEGKLFYVKSGSETYKL